MDCWPAKKVERAGGKQGREYRQYSDGICRYTRRTSAAVEGELQEGEQVVVAEMTTTPTEPRRGLFGPRR